MNKLRPGQRWISEMEPELGLGSLIDISGKRVRIRFEGSDCTRQYLLGAAPLRRVRYVEGDTIISRKNRRFRVTRVEEDEGLLVYHGEGISLDETELAHHMGFTAPRERMAAGVFDSLDAFDLRYDAHVARHDLDSSDILGFTGGRVGLIPHQFYIASEVSARHIPRVLLADETGLGKTIEACLILHRLLLCERISRVLIIVPESLVHQWFVELYRRFNLVFRIFDEAHYRSLERAHKGVNPFEDEQLIIAGLEFFLSSEKRRSRARDTSWDMVVVDEAHHLAEQGGDALGLLSQLGDDRTGMLLLSATPEQLGRENYFALLRLLDPARYSDFSSYLKEIETYGRIASRVEELLDKDDGDAEIRRILDTQGPGRAVFRNTRAAISGFPGRRGILYPLDQSRESLDFVKKIPEGNQDFSRELIAKADWLVSFLKDVPGEKILVICSSMERAVFMEHALKRMMNLKIALFHEEMPLIERDRKAAWFSQEEGARLLISSEIGSEGRNFQFARHLVMGDLPLNPELMEQRIGRLDRIGQTREIFIHVPYLAESSEEILARWYKDGTGLFEENISGLHLVGVEFKERLEDLLHHTREQLPFPESRLDELIRDTRTFTKGLREELARGKDRLLELASFREDKTEHLLRDIRLADENGEVKSLMLALLDHFEIEVDEAGSRIYRLSFSDMTGSRVSSPVMKRNPVFVTFDRETALSREDLEFLSRDHPMVMGSLELLLGGETGNTALAHMKGKGSMGLLLEAVFLLESIAPKGLQITRYLPRTPVRVVVNHLGEDLTREYPPGALGADLTRGDPGFLREVPEIREEFLPKMINQSREFADSVGDGLIKKSRVRARDALGEEAERLIRLRAVNPAVKERDIRMIESEAREIDTRLGQARLRLDALRLIRII